MIVYDPFWQTLYRCNESTYTLIKNYNISSSAIDRLRNNLPVTTSTLNKLCRILHCQPCDIAKYVPSDED